MKRDPYIKIHSQSDFESMRRAGALAAATLDYISPIVQVGVTTDELNDRCHDFILSHHAIPAPLNYKGYPKSICTSINHVVCHGIPGPRALKDGDILNIDVTVILDGWYGDSSRMFAVGKNIPIKAKQLMEATYEAMWRGIEAVAPGKPLNTIGLAIQKYAESKGFSVVRDFCGHGIGKIFHGEPAVLHYYDPSDKQLMAEGMFFTIEPMINIGKKDTIVLSDGWTAITRDRSLSAQYEHTIAVTSTGYEVFTLSAAEQLSRR